MLSYDLAITPISRQATQDGLDTVSILIYCIPSQDVWGAHSSICPSFVTPLNSRKSLEAPLEPRPQTRCTVSPAGLWLTVSCTFVTVHGACRSTSIHWRAGAPAHHQLVNEPSTAIPGGLSVRDREALTDFPKAAFCSSMGRAAGSGRRLLPRGDQTGQRSHAGEDQEDRPELADVQAEKKDGGYAGQHQTTGDWSCRRTGEFPAVALIDPPSGAKGAEGRDENEQCPLVIQSQPIQTLQQKDYSERDQNDTANPRHRSPAGAFLSHQQHLLALCHAV